MGDKPMTDRPMLRLLFEFGPEWATDEDLARMSDGEIIELAQEDITAVWRDSTIKVIR